MCNCLNKLAEDKTIDHKGLLIPTSKDGKLLIPCKFVTGDTTNMSMGVIYLNYAKYCPICGEKY